jgi:hypothetical protein
MTPQEIPINFDHIKEHLQTIGDVIRIEEDLRK